MRKIELLFLLLLVCLSSNAANKDSLIIRFFSWQMESPHNITCLNFENEVPYKEYIITSPVVIDSMSDQLQKLQKCKDTYSGAYPFEIWRRSQRLREA